MTTLTTKVFNAGGLTITISGEKKTAAEKVAALLEVIADRIDHEAGIDAPARPGHKPPGSGVPRPDHDLPEAGTPDNTLPPGISNELPGEQPEAGQLPEFLRDNAKLIAAAILKDTPCDPEPKK